MLEIAQRVKALGKRFIAYLPESQFIDGVQWHALVPVDSTFHSAIEVKYCTYPAEYLVTFINACKAVGGAVTLNFPIGDNGHLPNASIVKLRAIGDAIRY